MNRILALTIWFLLIALLPIPVRADLRGSWTATPADDGMLQWQFSRERNHHGQAMPLDAFTGLTEAQIAAATQTQVAFELRRDAGTLAMEGVFRQREGAGHFNFRPNPRYYDSIRALGVELERDDDEDKLFSLAMIDVSPQYIRSMQQAGYRVSLDQYMAMRIFRVTPQLVDELRSLGYRNVEFDDLIASRVHRVTPEYIRSLKNVGYSGIPVSKLIEMRIHGIDADYIAKVK